MRSIEKVFEGELKSGDMVTIYKDPEPWAKGLPYRVVVVDEAGRLCAVQSYETLEKAKDYKGKGERP